MQMQHITVNVWQTKIWANESAPKLDGSIWKDVTHQGKFDLPTEITLSMTEHIPDEQREVI